MQEKWSDYRQSLIASRWFFRHEGKLEMIAGDCNRWRLGMIHERLKPPSRWLVVASRWLISRVTCP